MQELFSTKFKTVIRDDKGIFRSVKRFQFEIDEYVCLWKPGKITITKVIKRSFDFDKNQWEYLCLVKSIENDESWSITVNETELVKPSNDTVKLMIQFVFLRDQLKEAYATADKSRLRILTVIEKLNVAGITVNY